jgi:DNA-binding LacI/PurR family transcriptional regulator
MKNPPTIHDLAADLNISATTVWRALNNQNRISTATRERVLARAAAINYAPSLVAQNLSRGHTQTLGVVVPMVDHPVFASLIEKIEEAAFHRGYNVILCDARLSIARETEYARMLLRRRVEGVIVVPFAKRDAGWDAHLVELQKRNVPVILLEQNLPTTRFTRIVADNFGAAYAVTRHLIDLGHKSLAFAFHPVHEWDPVGKERLAGFDHAVAEAGLEKRATRTLDAFAFSGEHVWRYQRQSIVDCFSRKGRPTALFCGMDMLAIQAMQTLREMDLRIPSDVAVAGFDNIAFSQFTQPPLTTVQQPIAEMGRRGADILFDRIEGKRSPREKVVCERLPCQLVIRQSCGAAN